LLYRFDKYEVNDEEFYLSRQGVRVALEPKALRVLLFFVQSPGRLLQKDAILQAVWKGSIVEESTLSRAVAILRKQLGDDPRSPTFIETVPTQGYRFIATVEASSKPVPAGEPEPEAAELRSRGHGAPPPDEAMADDTAHLSVRPGKRSKLILAVLAAALVLAAPLLWIKLHPRPNLTARQALIIGEFANSTGDPVFDETLRQGLKVQLEQSPLLVLVSETRIRNTLLLMNHSADTPLTPDIAREICQRTGSAAALEGAIASLGSQYVLTLQASMCASGEIIATEQVQAVRKEDVLRALSDIASKFRGRIGESLASIRTFDTPLDEATTASLKALKAFSESNRLENLKGSAAAIPLAQRAVELDPKFALAWAVLGRLYGDIGLELLSAQSTAKAYEFRDHASDPERFFIVASYEMQVTGNLEKAEQTCESWARIHPRDPGAYGFRAGVILRVFGRYQDAGKTARQLLGIHPDFALAYHFVALNDIALGRLAEARAVLANAAEHGLEIPYYSLDRYRLAFLAGDESEENRVTTTYGNSPGTQDMLAGQQAASLAYGGRLDQARAISLNQVSLLQQVGRREAAARAQAAAALREAFFANRDMAERAAVEAVNLSKGRDAEYGAAFALALNGNVALAQPLADDLDKRFPEDTSVRFHYLPAVRALIALAQSDPARAIDLLRANTPYELGAPQSSFSGFYGVLYPVYVRGLAYLAMHRGAQAAAEFQKILDHPELVVDDPIGALAHLEIGRAYADTQDNERAKEAYQDFLLLWKRADPEIPLLKEARNELSRLD
jgi:DNA-binding winged helix-turn-helix (wHTH) protein